jgi:hypothetical protein
MEVHGDMNKTKKKDKATVTRSASSSKRDSHKAPAAPRSVDGKIPNGPERIVYGSKEMEAAANLWNTDPVAAFKEYFRLLADNPSEDAQERLNDFFGFLKDEIKLHPDKIVATDKRLNKAERDDVLARQKAHRKAMQPDQRKAKQAVLFREEAAGLDFLVEAAREDGIPLDWRALEKHFYNLEMAFDPSFYNTGVGEMTGSPDDIQIKRDAIIASRQTKMAQALFALNPTLANQHADVLRNIKAPPGLPDTEKRTPFLREIERKLPAANEISYPFKHKRLTVENSEWTQFRYEGIARLFDLGHRYKAARTINVMLLALAAVGRKNAKPERTICEMAGITNGHIRSSFSDRSGDAPLCKELCDLIIKNDGKRRSYYFLDIT